MALPEKTENSPRVKKVSPWYNHKSLLEFPGSFLSPWTSRREGPWCGGRGTGITCHHPAALGTKCSGWRRPLLPSAKHCSSRESTGSWSAFLTWRSILASFPTLFACRALAVGRFAMGKCGQCLCSEEAEGSLLVLTLSRLELSTAAQIFPNALVCSLISLCAFSPSIKIAPSLNKVWRGLQTAMFYCSSALLGEWSHVLHRYTSKGRRQTCLPLIMRKDRCFHHF